MATICKRGNTYKITVSMGHDENGKQVRKCATYKPEPTLKGRALEKALRRFADDFEDRIKEGKQDDQDPIFADYADEVLRDKLGDNNITRKTYAEYCQKLKRINREIGQLKVTDISIRDIQHLKRNLQLGKNAHYDEYVYAKPAFVEAATKETQTALATAAGINVKTVKRAIDGEQILAKKAERLCSALKLSMDDAFSLSVKDGKPLTGKTVCEHLSVVSVIMQAAKTQLIINDNPVDHIRFPSAKAQEEESPLTEDEIQKVREAAKSEPLQWRCILQLFLDTGDRRGAVAGVKLENIDLEHRKILMQPTILSVGGRAYEKSTQKTVHGNRTVTIRPETAELIRQLLVEREKKKQALGDRWKESGYLFTGREGGHLHPDSINDWMEGFSKRHGLRKIHPHLFRHTVATILANQQMPVNQVAAAIGDVPETVVRYYIHGDDSASRAACKILDTIYSKQ